MSDRGAGERKAGGQMARTRVTLARALVRPDARGTSALRAALRDYVRAAREAGLGARATLADVGAAWRKSDAAARRALTWDVLEVATLLELGAGDEHTSRELRRP